MKNLIEQLEEMKERKSEIITLDDNTEWVKTKEFTLLLDEAIKAVKAQTKALLNDVDEIRMGEHVEHEEVKELIQKRLGGE